MTVKDLISLNPVPNNYGCVFWKNNISCVFHLYSKRYFNDGCIELKYRLNFATKRIEYDFIS